MRKSVLGLLCLATFVAAADVVPVKGRRPAGEGETPWSDAEAKARWHADSGGLELKKLLRTRHYLILTNSSGGALFARKMEEFHKKIRKVFPFEERAGARRLPVLLFRNSEQYFAFTARATGLSPLMARQTKGHAYKDYYATWYVSPNDAVHIHEATHQIFTNRLGLPGGGSWFQEGVAEYMSTRKNERKAWARGAARRGGYVPWTRFIGIEQLAANSLLDGKSSYLQAASLIDFLRHDKKHKQRFEEFIRRMGNAPRGDRAAIEEALGDVYGIDLAELEARWVRYWKR